MSKITATSKRAPSNRAIMSKRTGLLTRRNLLGGGAAAAALAPFVPVLSADAQSADAPKRILFYVFHNGTIMDEYWPTGMGRDFELKRILAPLEPFKERMTIVGGVDMDPAPGGAHTGQGMLLTNTEPNSGRIGQGISVDQYLAAEIGQESAFPSLHVGNHSHRTGELWLRRANDPFPAENSPYRTFDRVFADFSAGGDTSALESLRARRQSVIDRVSTDLDRFRGALGSVDQELVDRHLTSVRELERALEASTAVTCAPPDLQGGVDTGDTSTMPEISVLNNQLMQAIFSCDMTRVVGMPVTRPVANVVFRWTGSTEGHHNMSHESPSTDEPLTEIGSWLSGEIADLLARFEATPEGGGSMLDNTLLVFLNPLSNGDNHSKRDLPITMVGGQWHFDTGRYVRYQNEPHGKFLVSLCQAMGVDTDTFGEADTSRGPLTGLAL